MKVTYCEKSNTGGEEKMEKRKAYTKCRFRIEKKTFLMFLTLILEEQNYF